MSTSPGPEEWLEIGTIVAAQGIRGELRVLSTTDFPQRFEKKGTRWLQSPKGEPPQPVNLLSGRQVPGKNLFIVQLADVKDRNEAERLVGSRLLITAGDRLPLAKNEYHVRDLIGLNVYDHLTGNYIGVVSDLFEAGNDLLEVQLDNPNSEPAQRVLIPFVQAIVPMVDLVQQRLEISPPSGLLELATSESVPPEQLSDKQNVIIDEPLSS